MSSKIANLRPRDLFWTPGNPIEPPEEWKAAWIWRDEQQEAPNTLARFRKTFTLEDRPDRAVAYVSASTEYRLWVNGVIVLRGPLRCAPHHQSFDAVDIASLLKAGENIVAAEVFHRGNIDTYVARSCGGFLFQCSAAGRLIASDDTWETDEARALAEVLIGEVQDGVVLEHWNLAREAYSWQTAGHGGEPWKRAVIHKRKKGWPARDDREEPSPFELPWLSLHLRDTPYLLVGYEPTRLVKGYDVPQLNKAATYDSADGSIVVGGIPLYAASTDRYLPLQRSSIERNEKGVVIQNAMHPGVFSNEPQYSTFALFELPRLCNGYMTLELEGSAGSIVDLAYATELIRGEFIPTAGAACFGDRVVLSGKRDRWTSATMKSARYIGVTFRGANASLKMVRIGMETVEYPFDRKGSLSLPDKTLMMLDRAGENTLRAITTDAYTDNYRERRQYSQTAFYAARANYAVFADRHLIRRLLLEMSREALGDGILRPFAPVHTNPNGNNIFIDGTLFWILDLRDYLFHAQDMDFVQEMYPTALKAMRRLSSFENAEGLLEHYRYSYWIDHAPIDRRGVHCALNGLYILVCEAFAEISDCIGAAEHLPRKDTQAMRKSLRRKLWNIRQGVFSDAWIAGKQSPVFSEQSNCLAILSGIADPKQVRMVAERMLKDDSGLVPNVLFMYLFLSALCDAGFTREAFAIMKKRHAAMLSIKNPTLWEEWSPLVTYREGLPAARMRCSAQGENTYPPALFAERLLGISPLAPAFSLFSFRPGFTAVPWAKGSVPAPGGGHTR